MPQRRVPFALLILDCDGVVVDSEPITLRVLAEMLAELGISMEAGEAARRFTGHTFARTLELIGETLGAPPPPQFAADYRDRTYAAMEKELRPVAGIEQALDRVSIPYCVASNGPHEKMRKTLGITSLLPRFEGRMFSSADVARGKPFPDLFLHAASRFGVPPSACLVIEDSAHGIAAALAAGMAVYGYCGTRDGKELLAAGARGVLRRMSELPAVAAGAL